MQNDTTHTSKLMKLGGASICAMVMALSVSAPAAAQQSSTIIDNEDGSSEVIITVERRAQSLQDYAGTAAAISGDELKLLGITDFQEIDGKIPGLSIANNQGNVEVYIRGVGSSNNTELGDPAAAFHFNDVYLPRPAGIGAAFFDIERVEVNIGPQGTLRGRNATAGSINAIPWKPGLGQFDALLEAGIGNYGETTVEAMINAPIGENSALRLAAFKLDHDSYYQNISPCSTTLAIPVGSCEDEGVGVAEAADDMGLRATFLTEPTDALTFTVTADYNENKGTGYTGTNYANPLGNDILPEDIDDPRKVYGRAITPEEDTVHQGIKGHIEYDGNGWNAEYIGSFRDLVYDYEFVTPAGPQYDGALDTFDALTFDNFSRIRFITDSESMVHEFRLFSDNDSRLTWSVGAFYFDEAQRTFLGTTGDRNPFFTGVEFNQTTDTESYSFYGDATYNISDSFRVTGGLRFTDDHKERFGVNARYQFIIGTAGFGCCQGTGVGTEGFEFAGLDRTIFNPNTDGSVDINTGNPTLSDDEILAFYFDGIARNGGRDGLSTIYANGIVEGGAPPADHPLCAGLTLTADCPVANGQDPFFDDQLDGRISFAVLGGNSIALQNGSLDNDFVDWRARMEYDLDDNHLLYGLVATGNKSGGFNDNVPGTEGLASFSPNTSAPAAFDSDTLAPTYGPEKLTLFELGSKNEFDIGDNAATFNVSAFYYDYNDLQLTSLLSTAQIFDIQGIDLTDEQRQNLGGNVVAFTFNASDAEIYGAQFEGGIQLPGDLNIDATLLWLKEARVTNANEIQDSRYQADADIRDDEGNPINAVNRSIDGNRLIKTPEWQFNSSISKAVNLDSGSIDGVLSVGYRSSQHMTIFNGIDYNPDDDTDLRLNDTVKGYWTFDAGAGYSHGDDGKWRLEGYVSNITNQQKEQAIIITQFDNTRFFSRPRTYGVRLRVRFP
ncbi:TonB-dependent receptor [Litorimonas sp. RW-G-Af-16]|uniref:TonB-dependent receptor n=1 Tax=Litorimonas sp. RW-G-Af-16 TaxID=3241168 RepID=UPI00390C6D13